MRGLGGDGVDGEGESGSALSSDSGGDADGSTCSWDEAEADLGQTDPGGWVGRQVTCKGGHFDAAAECGSVDVNCRAASHGVDQAGGTLGESRDVGERWVGAGAEFAEVAAATERRPVTDEFDAGDAAVCVGQAECGAEFVAELSADGVVSVWAVQHDGERVRTSFDHDDRPVVRGDGRFDVPTPCAELVASLEHRVHRRLCGESLGDRQVRDHAEQDSE